MSKRVFIFQKLAILLLLGFALFLITINVPVVMAQSRPSQINFEELQAGPVLPPPFPALEFTAVETTYLPIIIRNPQPANPPPVAAGCNPTGGSGGLQVGAHRTTVAGLTAVVVVGTGYNPQTPTYLGFNLHGDGANYSTIEKASNSLNKLANERGWILVSPLAPNGQSWWTDFVGDHKQALANVFEEMFTKYNLCRNIIFGTTGSGGSEFWTSQFFPEKGGQYPAHTVVACGGGSGSSQKLSTLGKNPDVVARSTFYYVYGTEDSLLPGILRSIQSYSQAGFRVRINEIQGAGHCNKWKDQGLPSWHDWTATYWKEMASLLKAS
jgi:hypothetical protein